MPRPAAPVKAPDARGRARDTPCDRRAADNSPLVIRPPDGQGPAIQAPAATGRGPQPQPMTMSTFQELGIPADLIQGLEELGIITPTDVQLQARLANRYDLG